jgi:TRAP-type C4-dicarboxylate transport system permease small subunit
MQRLLKWLEKPIDVLFWIGLLATFLMMVHVTVDVFSRYLFNRPLDGTNEIVAVVYMVVIAYVPWAWIQVRGNHIVAGMFQDIGTPLTDYVIDIFVKLFTMLFLLVFVYQTLLKAIDQTRAGEVWLAGTMYVPAWPSRWVLPVSGALMLIYMAVRLVVDIGRGPQPRKPKED